MVDSTRPAAPAAQSGGTIIATSKRNSQRSRSAKPKRAVKARPAARAKAAPARKPARKAGRAAPARRASRRAPRAAILEQPLGMGVADGFAMDRLAAPVRARRTPKKAVREIGWAAFGEVARVLAGRIADDFRPDVVVGIAKGGVFVGGALAVALGADFHSVRIEKRRRDPSPLPLASAELPPLSGKRVLVVDDVASTGATLAKTRALARKSGAREVRTAVLVVRPHGARPDFYAFETEELVLFGWDYQLEHAGVGAVDPGEVGV